MDNLTYQILVSTIAVYLEGFLIAIFIDIFVEGLIMKRFTTSVSWWIPALVVCGARALNQEYYWAVVAGILAALGALTWGAIKKRVVNGTRA